jgi:hypothetical protein
MEHRIETRNRFLPKRTYTNYRDLMEYRTRVYYKRAIRMAGFNSPVLRDMRPEDYDSYTSR